MNAQSSERWDSYVATYEDGNPGSTTLRMDLIENAPLKGYDYVVVTGLSYETSRDDGFPEPQTFPTLHKLADELASIIGSKTDYLIVGSFMFNRERLEYFYVKNIGDLEATLKNHYAKTYPNQEYYLNIKEDKNWSYYSEFLYPNEETLNYMADQSVVRNLIEAGDSLEKERRVDHWIYFSKEKDMNSFKSQIKELGFQVQYAGVNEETELPFELQIWKIDFVDIKSIYTVTSELRSLSMLYKGQYDGWETSVETN